MRAQYNRAVPEGGKLWERLSSSTALGGVAFTQSARHGQRAREVRQAIWVERVTCAGAVRGGGLANRVPHAHGAQLPGPGCGPVVRARRMARRLHPERQEAACVN